MTDVIKFQAPIQSDPGATDMRIRSVTIDLLGPLVRIALQQCDEFGAFIENGKGHVIRHEGSAATTILASPAYAAVLASLAAQLVAGGSLPEIAEVIQK